MSFRSVLIILLNANPSLATRRDELPWIGTVQISTQSGRDTKQLHVQIRDDIAVLDSSAHPTLSSPHHQLKARYSEPLTLDSFSTPMAISGTSRLSEPLKSTPKNKILLPATALDFGSVPVRSSSSMYCWGISWLLYNEIVYFFQESHLEFTNVCPSTIRWILTSFAPAYVKSVESTGGLFISDYIFAATFLFSFLWLWPIFNNYCLSSVENVGLEYQENFHIYLRFFSKKVLSLILKSY